MVVTFQNRSQTGSFGDRIDRIWNDDWAVEEALADMESIPDYLRVRSFPFHQQVGTSRIMSPSW